MACHEPDDPPATFKILAPDMMQTSTLTPCESDSCDRTATLFAAGRPASWLIATTGQGSFARIAQG